MLFRERQDPLFQLRRTYVDCVRTLYMHNY